MNGNNALGIIRQTIRNTSKLCAIGMDSVNVEAVVVPPATIGRRPVVVSREDDALAVG